MKKRTLQLFQLLLLVFCLYSLLIYTGNMRLLISLACLVGVFLIGKIQTAVAEQEEQGITQVKKPDQNDDKKAIHWLLNSKKVLLLTDAVQYILKDLSLEIIPSTTHPYIDRLARIPGKRLTLGLKIYGDVADLDENPESLEELADNDSGRGGNRRLLIISSGCLAEGGNKEQKHKDYSESVSRMLSEKHLVAITTLTLYRIYMACKEKKVDIAAIFQAIQNHPGGVLRIERKKKRPASQ